MSVILSQYSENIIQVHAKIRLILNQSPHSSSYLFLYNCTVSYSQQKIKSIQDDIEAELFFERFRMIHSSSKLPRIFKLLTLTHSNLAQLSTSLSSKWMKITVLSSCLSGCSRIFQTMFESANFQVMTLI